MIVENVGRSETRKCIYRVTCRWGAVNERRTWNNPTREPWNPVIHQCLKAIDHHNSLYFQTGDPWHLAKAVFLREYVAELKDWIYNHELPG